MTRILEGLDDSGARQIAVIDCGSNTFRLVIFRYVPGGPFRLVDEVRQPVRISSGSRDGRIAPEAIRRAVDVARLFSAVCRNKEVDAVDAVATSAIRDARNRGEVLAALGEAGLRPRVLSEREEARYGLLGALNSTNLTDGFVLDIGGGSMQLTEARHRRMERSISRPLGAIRMTEAFLPEAPASRSAVRALVSHVREALADTTWSHAADARLVGVGGAVRTLAKMDQKRRRYTLSEVHGHVLDLEAIDELIETMRRASVSGRRRIGGLREDRADIMLAGAVVIRTAMGEIGVPTLEVCDQGLREGLFYEHFLSPTEPPLIADVRRAWVRNLAGVYGYNRFHAENVARLADTAYSEIARLGLQTDDAWERDLLWAASILHDVGILVDYNDHHKHSFYLVLNAGLPGHDHRELALVAALVRGHRKRLPSVAGLAGMLADDDEDRLLRLGACLRLAESLEQTRDGAVRTLRAEQDDGGATLRIESAEHAKVISKAVEHDLPTLERAFGPRFQLVSTPSAPGENDPLHQRAQPPARTTR